MAIRHQRSYAARQLLQARSLCLKLKLGIFRAGDDQLGADQINPLVFHLRPHEDGKCLDQFCRNRILHLFMPAKIVAERIGLDVPLERALPATSGAGCAQ
jgi:hypothetical protein